MKETVSFLYLSIYLSFSPSLFRTHTYKHTNTHGPDSFLDFVDDEDAGRVGPVVPDVLLAVPVAPAVFWDNEVAHAAVAAAPEVPQVATVAPEVNEEFLH